MRSHFLQLPPCCSYSFALGCRLIFFGGFLSSYLQFWCSRRRTFFYSTIVDMQVKKPQLKPDMEQWTSSKLRKEYIKAVYCHPAYLTYMQSTSCEMLGWMKHKLESRFPGEISITSDMQMTPPLWQKAKKNHRAS